MKMKHFIRAAAVTVASGLIAGWAFAATETPERTAMRTFMRQKLVHAQGILEGLSLEKYDLVAKSAVRLRDLSQDNVWLKIRMVDYMTYTTNYQKSIDAVYAAAVAKNLDAATEAYTKVTRDCVACHRLVRLEQHQAVAPQTKGKAKAVSP